MPIMPTFKGVSPRAIIAWDIVSFVVLFEFGVFAVTRRGLPTRPAALCVVKLLPIVVSLFVSSARGAGGVDAGAGAGASDVDTSSNALSIISVACTRTSLSSAPPLDFGKVSTVLSVFDSIFSLVPSNVCKTPSAVVAPCFGLEDLRFGIVPAFVFVPFDLFCALRAVRGLPGKCSVEE